jgi:hypothetical protein
MSALMHQSVAVPLRQSQVQSGLAIKTDERNPMAHAVGTGILVDGVLHLRCALAQEVPHGSVNM